MGNEDFGWLSSILVRVTDFTMVGSESISGERERGGWQVFEVPWRSSYEFLSSGWGFVLQREMCEFCMGTGLEKLQSQIQLGYA